ncbi:4a-hydroxytetrahydrobiopterin dehydratase [SAR86 cluster bacterium]|nr:4a-hydroxytetrahydrobiopterin dehydratase [SAR86 cluster bacterium]
MNELINKKCEACRIDAPKVSNEEIPSLMSQIPLWDVIEENNIKKLTCLFKFSDYEQSLVFTNKVATLADEEDHHPKITLEWGKVRVIWWSHKIQGLHQNDFICAAKTDRLYKN